MLFSHHGFARVVVARSSHRVGCFVLGAICLIAVGCDKSAPPSNENNSAAETSQTPPATNTAPDMSMTPSGGFTNPTASTPVGQESTAGPSSTSSGFQKPAEKSESLTLALSENWSVKADPPAGEMAFQQEKPLKLKLDADNLRAEGLVYPVTPSPLVAIKEKKRGKPVYVVRDLTNGQKVGEAEIPSSISTAALSADGSYLAVEHGSNKIDVYDLKTEKSLGTLQTDDKEKFRVANLAIVGGNRLIGVSYLEKGIKAWELPSGNYLGLTKGGEKMSTNDGVVFSPGGRYLATVADHLTKQIDVFDLQSGEVAGSILPAKEKSSIDLGAFGFSRDGTRLAALYEVNEYSRGSRNYSRIVVWELESKKVAADFEIEPQLKEQLDPQYKSKSLESFPGNTQWLVHSQGVIDTSLEQLVYSFPKQEGVSLVPSRRVLGSNWLMNINVDAGDPKLEHLEISQDQLQAGASSIAAGGIASDANLPPLTAADWDRATDAIAVNEWKVQPDPLAATQIKDSIRVSSDGTVRDFVISRSANPVVAIRAGIKEDLEDSSYQFALEYRAKLDVQALMQSKVPQPIAEESELLAFSHEGMEIARLRIPFSAELRGISPSGKLALVEQHNTNGRLDLYELTKEGNHRVGWRPYRTEAEERHREIRSATFIDDDHLATLSNNDMLVVWKLPSLEPVWKLNEVLGTKLSPGGKTLFAARGNILGAKTLSAFESLTGEGKGTLEVEAKYPAFAIHPNGVSLALAYTSGQEHLIRMYDLSKGEVVEEFPVPSPSASVAWCGNDYLLLNGMQLVSRPLQAVVWSYESDNAILPPFQVSEQICFAYVPKSRGTIRAVELPDTKVAARLDPARLADQAILKPGDVVNLKVDVAPDPLIQPLKAKATEQIPTRLKEASMEVAGNGKVLLNVRISLKTLGNENLTKLGTTSVSESVTRKAVVIDLVYQERGKEIWKSTRTVGNLDRFVVRLKPGESAQKTLDTQMIEQAESVLASLKLPSFIFGDNASTGLGSSVLGQ